MNNQRTTVLINSISINTPQYCLSCSQMTAKVTCFQFDTITQQDYAQLVTYGWKRCGNVFQNSSEESCCHQTSQAIDVDQYKPSSRAARALRHFKRIQLDRQGLHEYINRFNPEFIDQLPYIDLSMYKNNVMQTLKGQQAFQNFQAQLLIALQVYDPSIDLKVSSYCNRNKWQSDVLRNCALSYEQLANAIHTVNQTQKTNVVITKNKKLVFNRPQYMNAIEQYIQYQEQNPITGLIIQTKQMEYDPEIYALYSKYNQHYYDKATNEQNFKNRCCCQDRKGRFNLMKYYKSDDNTLIAFGIVDVLDTSMHRVAFYFDPAYSKLSLGVIAQTKEIELAKELNLSTYHYTVYQQSPTKELVHVPEELIQKIEIQKGRKIIQVKYLQTRYKDYLGKLFYQLAGFCGEELINRVLFKHI